MKEQTQVLTPNTYPINKYKGFVFLFVLNLESRERQWTFGSRSRNKDSKSMCVTVCSVSWLSCARRGLSGCNTVFAIVGSPLQGWGCRPEHYISDWLPRREFTFPFCQWAACARLGQQRRGRSLQCPSHIANRPNGFSHQHMRGLQGLLDIPWEPSATVLFPEIPKFAGFLMSSVALSDSDGFLKIL